MAATRRSVLRGGAPLVKTTPDDGLVRPHGASSGARSLRVKLLRFPAVGAASTLIYAIATSSYISLFSVGNELAAFFGYMTAVPFAFFGHRSFTFSSRGAVTTELGRFVLVHLIGLVVSWFSMHVMVGQFHLHYAFGIAGAMVLVPTISFVLFDRWVFRPSMPSGEAVSIPDRSKLRQ